MLEYDRIDVSEENVKLGCVIFGIIWTRILIINGICVTVAICQ